MTALLDVDEAAARLHCSRRRVFQLLADGTLVRGPCYGKRTVITLESVEAALAPPAPATGRPAAAPRAPRGLSAQLDDLSGSWT